jgi:hypothetical protein
MVGKRAKILSADNIEDLLVFARQTRYPLRNQVLVLLSVKAGLRARQIVAFAPIADSGCQIFTLLAADLLHRFPLCECSLHR